MKELLIVYVWKENIEKWVCGEREGKNNGRRKGMFGMLSPRDPHFWRQALWEWSHSGPCPPPPSPLLYSPSDTPFHLVQYKPSKTK